jgi:MFS family permease
LPRPLWTRTFVLAILATTALFLTLYLPLPVLPPQAKALGASTAGVGVAIGIFSLAAMVVRLLSGPLMDRGRRKEWLLGGLAVFALTALGYGYAPGFGSFLALRVLQGIGWGAVVTGVAGIVADLAPAERRGEAVGYWGLAPTLAMAVGPWMGGLIMAARDARVVFVGAGSLGVVAFAFLLPVPDVRPQAPAARQGPLIAFPTGARLPALVLLLSSFSYGAVVAFLPVELADHPGRAGLFFTLYAVAILLARPLSGTLSDRLGRAAVILPGLALGAVGAFLVGFAAHPGALPAAALLYGAGVGGASFPGLMALAVDRCPPATRTAGMALFFSAYDVAIASGSALLGLVYQAAGFRALNTVAASCILLSLVVLAVGLHREGRRRGAARSPAPNAPATDRAGEPPSGTASSPGTPGTSSAPRRR